MEGDASCPESSFERVLKAAFGAMVLGAPNGRGWRESAVLLSSVALLLGPSAPLWPRCAAQSLRLYVELRAFLTCALWRRNDSRISFLSLGHALPSASDDCFSGGHLPLVS